MSKNANMVLPIAMGGAGATRRRRASFSLWWPFASIITIAVTMCFGKAAVVDSLSMPSASNSVFPVPHSETLDYGPRIGVHHQQRSQDCGRSNSPLNTLPRSVRVYLHATRPYCWSPQNTLESTLVNLCPACAVRLLLSISGVSVPTGTESLGTSNLDPIRTSSLFGSRV